MRVSRLFYVWLYGLTAAALTSAALTASPMSAADAAPAAKRRPNIVFIMADDKYELGQSKIENTRKNRAKPQFHGRFQITGNCGELRAITGN